METTMEHFPAAADPDAEFLRIVLIRRTPSWKKLRQVAELTKACHELAHAGIRRQHPNVGLKERQRLMAYRLLPADVVEVIYHSSNEQIANGGSSNVVVSPLEILSFVALTFEELEVPYVIVGSFASSLHGMVRATNDADIVADFEPHQVADFVARVRDPFYVSEPAVMRATRERLSFNLIHFETSFKVDVFIPPQGGFGWQQLARRYPGTIGQATGPLYFATAEDMILAKLLWFQKGDLASGRQWSDVIEIIRVQDQSLDLAYMHDQATGLKVSDLLVRALSKAKLP